MVTLYVLKSTVNGKRYVGITNNLSRRLTEHRGRASKAGQLLGEFALLHTEEHPSHAAARVRERFLKSGQGREWLDQLEGRTRPACGG